MENSFEELKRSAGFFARSLWIRVAAASGTFGFSARTGVGSSVPSAINIAITFGRSNGVLPVQSQYNTAPRLNRSDRASTFSPRACSGDMYAGERTRTPVRVRT